MSKYKNRRERVTIRSMLQDAVTTEMIQLLDPAPIRKDPNREFQLWKMTGKNRRETIYASKCMSCPNKAEFFRDSESIKEYQNSGFCQYCQDVYFEDAH